MIQLPDEFREKMKRLLGAEYDSFIESYDKERVQGLRINPLKISREKFDEISHFIWKRFHGQKKGITTSG